jgi:hypothetical protein
MAGWLVRALLLALWLVGMVYGTAAGPWIHLLLLVAMGSIAMAAPARGGGPTSPHPTASGSRTDSPHRAAGAH